MSELPPVQLVIMAAEQLGDLCQEVTFLGGAVVSFLLTERGSAPPRSTKDVDVVINITSRMEYYKFDERLRERGFVNDLRGPVCRYLHGMNILDVMPVDPDVLGFTNRWYGLANETAVSYSLRSDLTIRLISPACFLATKLEAFMDPGRENANDIFTSRDFADIISVLDGRPSIIEEVAGSQADLRNFIQKSFSEISGWSYLNEALEEYVSLARIDLVLHRLGSIASSA